MDVQAYIASGILEDFVLGALSSTEEAEVRRLAQQHPEVAAEIQALHTTLEAFAQAQAVQPPPQVWASIQHGVKAQLPGTRAAVQPEQPHGAAPGPARSSGQSAGVKSKRWRAVASAALAVLLLVSVGAVVRLQQMSHKLDELISQNAALNTQLADAMRERDVQTAEFKALLTSPKTHFVVLNGVEHHPSAAAAVVWNRHTGRVLVFGGALPAPPAGHQYQVWAIAAGTPVDLGVLPIGEDMDQFQAMRQAPNAQAFAITLEPAGGSAQPTLDKMLVYAEVPA